MRFVSPVTLAGAWLKRRWAKTVARQVIYRWHLGCKPLPKARRIAAANIAKLLSVKAEVEHYRGAVRFASTANPLRSSTSCATGAK